MGQPRVSIVIPCYRGEATIRDTLEGCLAQTYPNLEIIVVDNNSPDRSAEIAREVASKSSQPIVVTHCATQGAPSARNAGYAHVTGEYVQWLDADDTMDPDKIELQVAALESDPSADIAYGDACLRFLPAGREVRVPVEAWPDQLLRMLEDIWVPPHGYLLRRSAADTLQRYGAWNPTTECSQDREYFAIGALVGLNYRYVPGSRIAYNRWSDQQLTAGVNSVQRARAHRDMFGRFREIAKSLDAAAAAKITDTHRLLLDQSWDLWRLPLESLEVRQSGSGVEFVNRATGAVSSRADEIALLWQMDAAARTFEAHSTRIANWVGRLAYTTGMARRLEIPFTEESEIMAVQMCDEYPHPRAGSLAANLPVFARLCESKMLVREYVL